MACAAFAYASLTGGDEARKASHKHDAVTLKGHVHNLHPGLTTTLKVEARNNLVNRVQLRGVKTKVTDASPDCPGTLLSAEKVNLKKNIPSHQSRTVKIPLTLSASAPDPCQNAKFPLKFKADARPRDGSS
jgi:hypothetical protein